MSIFREEKPVSANLSKDMCRGWRIGFSPWFCQDRRNISAGIRRPVRIFCDRGHRQKATRSGSITRRRFHRRSCGCSFLKNVFSTKESLGQRPTPGDEKNGCCSATTAAGSVALPFVISTGAVMGQRPTQGDEKRVLFSNYCCWKRRPPLCHLDRSAA
jgi:hypothetical protein